MMKYPSWVGGGGSEMKANNYCSYLLIIVIPHNANMSVQYTAIFHGYKNGNFQMKKCDIFLIFAQNIDRGCTLEPRLHEAVLTSTHNLCF